MAKQSRQDSTERAHGGQSAKMLQDIGSRMPPARPNVAVQRRAAQRTVRRERLLARLLPSCDHSLLLQSRVAS